MLSKSNLSLFAYVAFAVAILLVPVMVGGDAFLLNKFSRYIALGIVAVALSLSWGYGGILNLGQGAGFGLGAYAMAMHLKLLASVSNPGGLPDFMRWNNVDSVPLFWQPFHSLGISILVGIGLPALVAAIVGLFIFRARIAGVFVAIITLALLVVINLLFIDQQRYTGGFNGITDLAMFSVGSFTVDPYSTDFYYMTAGCLIAVLLFGLYVVRSKFGLVLQAIRGDAERVRYFGYDVAAYQTIAFTLSAAIAGIAGMLYAMVLEFASPTFMSVSLSLSIVIWCAVGGRQSLVAAAAGAILVNAMQGTLSEQFLDTAQLLLGGIFVLVVLFMPRGIGGVVEDVVDRLVGARRAVQPVEPAEGAEETRSADGGEHREART